MTVSRARGRDAAVAALLLAIAVTSASCATITVASPSGAPSPSVVAGIASAALPSATPSPTAIPSPEPSASAMASAAPSVSPIPSPTPAVPIGTAETIAPASTPPLAAITIPSAVDPFPTTPFTPTLDRRLSGKLKKVLAKTVSKRRVAGVSVAVMFPDGSIWTGSAGNAEYRPERPITDTTGFAIASVTKTFIAALILQLVDEGKLTLDEPYARWLPDGPRANNVTIRQLLDHRSGIHDYFDSERYRRAIYQGDPNHAWTYDEILGLVKDGYCKPDRCYRYSNTNYVLLGRIAETIEDEPLHRLLRERFFEPLGLTHTLLQPDDPTPLDAAHGHWASAGGFIDHTKGSRVIPFMAAASVANAAGAIVSTPRDLVAWADALYGGRVLSRASRHAMLTFLPPDYYGLGARRGSFAGHAAVGHRGGLRGFESSLWYFPQADVSIALLSNEGNWLTDVPLAKIAKAVFRRR